MVSIRLYCLNQCLNVNGTGNGTSGKKMRMDIILYLVFFAALVWAKIQLDTKRRGGHYEELQF